MKISKAFQLAAACLAITSSAAVLAGPQYKNVVYGARVLVNNMTCTQVITSYYSDAAMQTLIARDISYTACEANVGTPIGPIGKPGDVGSPGVAGLGGQRGNITDPQMLSNRKGAAGMPGQPGQAGSQGPIVDPNQPIINPERDGVKGQPGQTGQR